MILHATTGGLQLKCPMFSFNDRNEYSKLKVGNRQRVKYWLVTRVQGIQNGGNLRVFTIKGPIVDVKHIVLNPPKVEYYNR